jgi:hypothetical protein
MGYQRRPALVCPETANPGQDGVPYRSAQKSFLSTSHVLLHPFALQLLNQSLMADKGARRVT